MVAQLVALGLTALALGLYPAPVHWTASERTLDATAMAPGGLVAILHAVARALPIGELAQRLDLVGAGLLLGLVVVATRAAYALFRGAGRAPAAATAGAVAGWSVLAWAHDVGVAAALGPTAAACVATVALTAVLRARVHLGTVPPVAAARAIAAVIGVAALSVRTAVALGPVIVVACVLGARRHRTPRRRYFTATVIAAALPLLAVVAVVWLAGPPDMVGVPRLALPSRWPTLPVSAALGHAALALVALLGFVLRWRGGWVLLAWLTTAALVVDDRGPLVATPVLLVGLSICAAGWVWLAGSVLRYRPRVANAVAVVTCTAVVVWVGLAPLRVPEPVAWNRPSPSFVDVLARGLIAPGDVLVTHDGWLVSALDDRRAVEGWRPDLVVHDGRTLTDDALDAQAYAWSQRGRRLLSDSFDLGGRLPSTWAVDSGPLFWFVGPAADGDRDFTDLSGLLPDLQTLPVDDRRRMLRMQIERARFRRTVGAPDAALEALPLSDARHRALRMRMQLARAATAEAEQASELPSSAPTSVAELDGWVAAEAGDLLFSAGARDRAAQLLVEADEAGLGTALPALARWYVRAGQIEQAQGVIDALAAEARTDDLLALSWWLLGRGRDELARDVLAALPGEADDPAAELAARVAGLHGSITATPSPTPPAPVPETAERESEPVQTPP